MPEGPTSPQPCSKRELAPSILTNCRNEAYPSSSSTATANLRRLLIAPAPAPAESMPAISVWPRDESSSTGMTVASIVGLAVGLVIVAANIAAAYVVVKRLSRRRRGAAPQREQEEEGLVRVQHVPAGTQSQPRPYHYVKRLSHGLDTSGTTPLLGSQRWSGLDDRERSQEFDRADGDEGPEGALESTSRRSKNGTENVFSSARNLQQTSAPHSPSTSTSTFSIAGAREAFNALPSIRTSSLIPLSAASPSTVGPYSAFVGGTAVTPASGPVRDTYEHLPPVPCMPPPYDLHNRENTQIGHIDELDREIGLSDSTEEEEEEPTTPKPKPKFRLPSLKFANIFPDTGVQAISPSDLADVTASSGLPPSRTSLPMIKGPRPFRRLEDQRSSTTMDNPDELVSHRRLSSSSTLVQEPSSVVPVVLSACAGGPPPEAAWPSSPTTSSIYSEEPSPITSSVKAA